MNMFQLEDHDSVRVLRLSGDMLNLPEVQLHGEAEPVFGSLRGSGARTVIVDLASVPSFGSAFISVLIRVHKIVRQGGGEMVLAGASERAQEVLYLTGLNKLWSSFPTRELALEAAESGPAACTPTSHA
jgi:anti-anti-sigma factor